MLRSPLPCWDEPPEEQLLLCFPPGAVGWRQGIVIPTSERTGGSFISPRLGFFPLIIPFWTGIPALQLPALEEQSQASQPSVFQPGRKQLLGALIKAFCEVVAIFKEDFLPREPQVCFVRLFPLPSSHP